MLTYLIIHILCGVASYKLSKFCLIKKIDTLSDLDRIFNIHLQKADLLFTLGLVSFNNSSDIEGIPYFQHTKEKIEDQLVGAILFAPIHLLRSIIMYIELSDFIVKIENITTAVRITMIKTMSSDDDNKITSVIDKYFYLYSLFLGIKSPHSRETIKNMVDDNIVYSDYYDKILKKDLPEEIARDENLVNLFKLATMEKNREKNPFIEPPPIPSM
ncbi:MAG: hypothetical protein GY909_15775 [Oligoflexia bacterium]|nr:hypothetical protein [Oligoflexia bacterium]